MTAENKEAVLKAMPDGPRWPEFNETLKQLRNGTVPWRWAGMGCPTPPHPLDAIMARYTEAERRADEVWHREVAATPIDDATWEAELERRRQSEDDATHPERFRYSA